MIKEEKYTVYQKGFDITFIMVDTFKDEEIISSECVGWHFGEPFEDSIEIFTGSLKATFDCSED